MFLEENHLEKNCMEWLASNFPDEGTSDKENTRTHIQYIQHCRNKRAKKLGYWNDSPRFFDEAFGTGVFNLCLLKFIFVYSSPLERLL